MWDEYRNHFPKKSRHTLGGKIDALFLEIVELLFTAGLLYKEEKSPHLRKASIKLDTLKFFLQIAWEAKTLDTKKYITLSESMDEIGKMLGGWVRGLQKETPPQRSGGE